ncbi:MAG: hypothetical protein ISR96_06270 [Nitrospira sp.]|nr:hypothetical protein [bacterium]MBL7049099.1 hypothetical protein [Nitrospira sp.]
MKKLLIMLIALVMILSSAPVFAAEVDASNIMADTLILRPMGFLATVVGTSLFLVSYPIAKITDSEDTSYKVLIKEPVDYTFKRPIGEIGTGL